MVILHLKVSGFFQASSNRQFNAMPVLVFIAVVPEFYNGLLKLKN